MLAVRGTDGHPADGIPYLGAALGIVVIPDVL
jgi:hypothetical protein